ncbi:MAG: DNA-3-methyladenine glycosylase I [Gemmatimonadetes bacterium]|nr:DNA-3-methyladenine glycosylase I [Gemmatimonadota bacterium]
MSPDKTSCEWPADDDLMIAYHDEEWGVPLHDDRKLFEFLVLDAFQAGLSWRTILHKRENFRLAFDDFDAQLIARYKKRKIGQLLENAGIVRNRMKIEATVGNANAFLRVQSEYGSFDSYIWQFVGGQPKQNRWRSLKRLPASTPDSDRMSKDLKERGFKFVGTTICYAFMQAAGMVNDHLVKCFRYEEVRAVT